MDAVGIGPECQYTLPMTQEQLADATGLTPVHVNRVLKTLDEMGLVQKLKGSVQIHDFAGLADIGDFRPTYLHLPPSVPEIHQRGNA